MQTILCAIDDSDFAPRILRHAVGVAAALQRRLVVIHVGDVDAADFESRVLGLLPYGTPYLPELAVRVASGPIADAILSVADEEDVELIVAGTRARTAVARFFLGSVSSALLQRSGRPVLLVAPGDVDVVTLSPDRARLHLGPVLAAVDLDETNATQLAWASRLASLAHQPLELMTVARDGVSDHDAAAALRARAQGLGPQAPDSFMVRRGSVPEEIAHCARTENAGLIVMGLRDAQRGNPGKVASAVVEDHPALVLAVPASR